MFRTPPRTRDTRARVVVTVFAGVRQGRERRRKKGETTERGGGKAAKTGARARGTRVGGRERTERARALRALPNGCGGGGGEQ